MLWGRKVGYILKGSVVAPEHLKMIKNCETVLDPFHTVELFLFESVSAQIVL